MRIKNKYWAKYGQKELLAHPEHDGDEAAEEWFDGHCLEFCARQTYKFNLTRYKGRAYRAARVSNQQACS